MLLFGVVISDDVHENHKTASGWNILLNEAQLSRTNRFASVNLFIRLCIDAREMFRRHELLLVQIFTYKYRS